MANKVIVSKDKLNAIGDAIRNQLDTTAKYTLDEMPAKIESIFSGNEGSPGVKLVIKTDTPDFYGQTVYITDGNKTASGKFSNSGILTLNGVDMNGEVTIKTNINEEEYITTTNIKTVYETNFDKVGKKTYTLKIDINDSNPNTWGEWIDDATEVTECSIGGGENEVDALMGYYPVSIDRNGNEIDIINPSNYLLTKKGENLTEPNRVMVKFPRRGYRIWKPDENHVCISITNEQDKENYTYLTYKTKEIDAIYIGAYQGNLSDKENGLNSASSIRPSYGYGSDFTIKGYSDSAHLVGEGFEILTYPIITYLQCCAFIKYKGKQIQKILGEGVIKQNYNGTLNTQGLNYGDPNDNNQSVKLFGIENLMGGHEVINQAFINSSGQLFVGDCLTDLADESQYYLAGSVYSTSNHYSGTATFSRGPSGKNTILGFAALAPQIAEGSNDTYLGIWISQDYGKRPCIYGNIFGIKFWDDYDSTYNGGGEYSRTGRLVYFKTKK